MNLTLSPHARRQAEAKNIALAAVWAVALNPQATYGSFRKNPATGNREPYRCQRHGTEQQKWTGEAYGVKLCLAVNPCCGTVVTIWLDQVETDLRADQRAAGVTGYRGRDGKWRGDGSTAARPTGPQRKPLTAKQRKAKKKARHAARLANEQGAR